MEERGGLRQNQRGGETMRRDRGGLLDGHLEGGLGEGLRLPQSPAALYAVMHRKFIIQCLRGETCRNHQDEGSNLCGELHVNFQCIPQHRSG